MAVDLAAIKRRMAELNGTAKKSSMVQLWKPGPGEYRVRCLPWKNSQDGQPFAERWFYYLENIPGLLTPKQFGHPDPIDDLIRKLYSSGKPEDRNLAKQLYPKMRAYAPVIVHGQEDKGPMVWSFGKIIYQRLLGFFIDEDYGDITDPENGFDLKVTIVQLPGKQYPDTTVDCRNRSTKAHADPAVVQKWLDAVPDIDDMYRLKSKEEIETILNNWLNGDTTNNTPDEGTARGAAPKTDVLDDIVNEVKETAAAKSKPKPPPKKEVVDVDSSDIVSKKQTLDEAFDELMEE